MGEILERSNALLDISKQKFIQILDKIGGEKDLVIDASLMKPLDRFINVQEMKNRRVVKIYKLLSNIPVFDTPKVVYIVPCTLIRGKIVCDQLSKLHTKELHVIFIPRLLTSVEKLFEEEGLFGKVTLHVLAWELIQLDTNILSFEFPQIFKNLFVENDQSDLPAIAKSLWSFQHVFGKIPNCLYHGRFSKLVSNMVDIYFDEIGAPNGIDSEIGCMIVLDRDIDYPSVLLTPGTYTSLLADVMNVRTSVLELIETDKTTNEMKTSSFLLTSQDEIYCQIKNKHFSEVFNFLSFRIKDFQSRMGQLHNMDVQELKSFVKSDLDPASKTKKTLAKHINICESVTNIIGKKFESIQANQHGMLRNVDRKSVISYIKDIMVTRNNMNLALRLILLFLLTQSNFTKQEFNSLKTQFLQAYGFKHLMAFYNIQKLGLYTSENESNRLMSKVVQIIAINTDSKFQTVARNLRLLPDDTKDSSQTSYVFGGSYIPLVAQLINLLFTKGKSITEIIEILPGNNLTKNICNTVWKSDRNENLNNIKPRSIFVYFVGGVTYAEIAVLQMLEKETGFRILVGGSSIITGNNIAQSVTTYATGS